MSALRAAVAAPPATAAEPPVWQVWTGLAIVYVVWGSTYLAIRVMVETVPPLLGAGLRFTLAGAGMVAFLAVRRGVHAVRPTRPQLFGALLIGILLPGANAVVTIAEVEVPSNVAALLIAAVPLVIVLLRRATGDVVSRASLAGVLVGFAGVALLLAPGGRPDDASLLGMAGCLVAAVMWATGSFSASKLDLPRDPLVSVGWQMLLGGLVIVVAGVVRGEAVHPASFSVDSLLAFAYLVLIGSLIAYTAYAWLLRNVPVSKVATYAYVNPAVAILLGWLVLDEAITGLGAAGAAVIVGSVAVVVRAESVKR